MFAAPHLVEHLSFLVGALEGTELLHPTRWGSGGRADAVVEGHGELQDDVLIQRHTQLHDGVVSFTAVNIFMWDRDTGEILLYSFDTYGFPADPPARGVWVGDELVLDRATDRGHSRTTYVPTAAGYRWSKQFRWSAAEDWSPVVEGELTRRAAG